MDQASSAGRSFTSEGILAVYAYPSEPGISLTAAVQTRQKADRVSEFGPDTVLSLYSSFESCFQASLYLLPGVCFIGVD